MVLILNLIMRERKVLLVFAILIALNFFSWKFLFFLQNEELRVVFFDVGQGDAIFIRTPQKHHILIDGGPGEVVLEGLGREMPFFYNHIDLVVLTHPHDDHVSGLLAVLDRYNVETILCTGISGSANVAQRWEEAIKERGYVQARAGQRIRANDFYLDILYPAENFAGERVSDLNEVSVISRFVFREEHSFLLTGDAYADQEREVLSYKEKCEEEGGVMCDVFSLESDVLKVGHHGSRTSTSEEFLDAVSPKVAVIMAGKDNRYGHPHREVLERLEDLGVKIMRTDRDGDIFFNISP